MSILKGVKINGGFPFDFVAEVDNTLTVEGAPADAKKTGDEIADLKSAITVKGMPSGGSSGQILRKASETNYDAEWVDPEAPTTEQVNAWLDDHPEATTSVEDGSLTEAKLTASTLASLKNNYVTPEMYGAVGDGSADDTEAINSALSSGYDVYFGNKTYIVTGAVINDNIKVYFDNTTLKAKTKFQDYILSVNTSIVFDGYVIFKGDSKALIGAKFTSSYHSYINRMRAEYCLLWGIVLESCGHMRIGNIYTTTCGTKISITASRTGDYVLTSDNVLTDDQKTILSSSYAFDTYFYDTSEFSSNMSGPYIRKVIGFNSETNAFTLHNNSKNKLSGEYLSKTCNVCVGGGFLIGDGNNGQIDIDVIDTRLGTAGIGIKSTYGHTIGNFYSQNDWIPVVVQTYCLGTVYGSVTSEGSKSGYIFVSYNYDYSVVICKSTGYDSPFASSDMISVSGGTDYKRCPILIKSALRRVLPFGHDVAAAPTITENSSDIMVVKNNTSIKVDLNDESGNGYAEGYSPWGVKTIYFMPSSNLTGTVTIQLSDTLVAHGFTIMNGTSGVLTFTRPSRYFVARIFRINNEFIVVAESITPAVASTS